jgi:hypothetical protein
MRINVESEIPQKYMPSVFARILRAITQQLNLLSEGFVQAATNAATAMPTSGTYKQGDFVRKSDLVEAGGAGAKYVITGWLRLTDGSAHVLNTDWVTSRVLTGN